MSYKFFQLKFLAYYQKLKKIVPWITVLGIFLAFTFASPKHIGFFHVAEAWTTAVFNHGGNPTLQMGITFVFNFFRFLLIALILVTVATLGWMLAEDRVSDVTNAVVAFVKRVLKRNQ